jgi:basic membrane lipoprotein Med (substrate-binding protein (PBP1-ABC) superfamily)
MTENDRIGYVADYPIYGMIANINAFALGVTLTNPRARIYLDWSTRKGYDRTRFLEENDIHLVSDQDMITPQDASRMFGLYRYRDGEVESLLMPLWNWGVFYEKMIRSILAGSYQTEGSGSGQALNYWWGMSAGVIDLICSKSVPTGVRRLSDHMKRDLKQSKMVPFYGEMRSQDGVLRNEKNQEMKPEDIMTMDYLLENIVGSIPAMETLNEAAKSVVQLKGVEESK